MADTKPRVKRLSGWERCSGFSRFGVTVVGVSEDGFRETGLGGAWSVSPAECSVIRFRCDACGAEFDVEPGATDKDARAVPLCPNGCNRELLERLAGERSTG
jgi:hypothetical protein